MYVLHYNLLKNNILYLNKLYLNNVYYYYYIDTLLDLVTEISIDNNN